ncbi:MAG TPA: tetratricopeptide repeat protein, partial [bacterium]|nr:tetratricopeptide repeat protein [bacterium]
QNDVIAALEQSFEKLYKDRPSLIAGTKNLNRRMDELENAFSTDLPSFRETVAKVQDGDELRTALVNDASNFFNGYLKLAEEGRTSGEEIIAFFDETMERAGDALYRLKNRRIVPANAIHAANDLSRITAEIDASMPDRINSVTKNAYNASRSYDAARRSMQDLDFSFKAQDGLIDSASAGIIRDKFEDQIDQIVDAMNASDSDRSNMERSRLEVRRATLNLNTALLSPAEKKVYLEMLQRRLGIKPEDVNNVISRGFGIGDAVLEMNRRSITAKKNDTGIQTPPAIKKDQSRNAGPAMQFGGDILTLRLAEQELTALTLRKPLVEITPAADPDFSLISDDSNNETTDPELAKAISLLKENKLEEAKKIIQQRGKNRPATALSHTILGTILRLQDNQESAIEEFKYASKRAPKNVDIRILIGNTYAEMQLFEDALKEYEEAEKIDPARSDVIAAQGYALSALGKDDDAESKLKRSIDMGDKAASTRLNLGLLCYSKGRVDEAIEDFKASLQIDPNQPLVAKMIETIGS